MPDLSQHLPFGDDDEEGGDSVTSDELPDLPEITVQSEPTTFNPDRLRVERHHERQAANEIRAEIEAEALGNKRPAWLEGGKLLRYMDEPTIEAFVYEEAAAFYTPWQVAEAYAGERNEASGIDGVKVFLFSGVRERITSRISAERDGIRAFNDETDNWPHELRAELAGFEFREGRGDVDGYYADQLRDFAEQEGKLDMEYTQTELTSYYGFNPYNDDELSDEEAHVVIVARHYDVDESEISFSEIENHENFIWWLKETQDVEAAQRGHLYGTDVPTAVVSQAAPPSSWDTLDPENIEEGECYHCNSAFHHIVHAEHGAAWVGEDDGQLAVNIDDPSAEYYRLSEDGDGNYVFCDECQSQLGEDARHRVVVYDGEDYLRCHLTGDLVLCTDNRVDDISSEATSLLSIIGTPPNVDQAEVNTMELRPQARPDSDPEDQENLLITLYDSPAPFVDNLSDGPVALTVSDSPTGIESAVLFDRTKPILARDVKEMLERPDDFLNSEVLA